MDATHVAIIILAVPVISAAAITCAALGWLFVVWLIRAAAWGIRSRRY